MGQPPSHAHEAFISSTKGGKVFTVFGNKNVYLSTFQRVPELEEFEYELPHDFFLNYLMIDVMITS